MELRLGGGWGGGEDGGGGGWQLVSQRVGGGVYGPGTREFPSPGNPL